MFGQQEPRMSQYMTLPSVYNPSILGLQDGIEAAGVSRTQWAGLRDYEGTLISPQTFFVSADAGLPMIGGGLSILVMNEKIMPISQTKMRLNYAYHLKIKNSKLNFGLMVGLTDQSLDLDKINPDVSGDPAYAELTGQSSSMNFDAGLGVSYHIPDKFYVGLSAMQLLATKARYKTDNVIYKDALSFNLSAGYTFGPQYRPEWKFQPSILMSLSKGIFQMDIDFLVQYNKKIWGGVGYRINDAVVAMIGFRIKDFKFGYSYDITTSAIRAGGTHEIMLKYYFKIDFDKSAKSYRNTRYL
jgi:type IX secretion system PorP/SprF family membrane protein